MMGVLRGVHSTLLQPATGHTRDLFSSPAPLSAYSFPRYMFHTLPTPTSRGLPCNLGFTLKASCLASFGALCRESNAVMHWPSLISFSLKLGCKPPRPSNSCISHVCQRQHVSDTKWCSAPNSTSCWGWEAREVAP